MLQLFEKLIAGFICFAVLKLVTFSGIYFQPPNIHFLLIIFDKQIIFLLFFSWGNVCYSLFVSILKLKIASSNV